MSFFTGRAAQLRTCDWRLSRAVSARVSVGAWPGGWARAPSVPAGRPRPSGSRGHARPFRSEADGDWGSFPRHEHGPGEATRCGRAARPYPRCPPHRVDTHGRVRCSGHCFLVRHMVCKYFLPLHSLLFYSLSRVCHRANAFNFDES